MAALTSRRASRALEGRARVPGDKSISHRSLMLGALAVGETRVTGLLEGEDVLDTAKAMSAMGARIAKGEDGVWRVNGVGVGGLAEPENVLDLGNSGTSARLLMGLIAGHPITAFITGDASLRRRPMGRVAEPLQRMGARIIAREGGRPPLCVIGARSPLPIRYTLPVASAQVKSAILLAGLNAPGETTVIEPEPTRDHTELMLRHLGAEVRVEQLREGGRAVTVVGQPELKPAAIEVPADPSSAAFPAVAALLVEGSAVTLEDVGINPLRAGLYETLVEMGADIAFTNRRSLAGEPVADLVVRSGRLKGIDVPPERAPRMIDEYPILAVAAALAEGRTLMRDIGELKVKESNRLDAVARGLAACGARVETGDDWLAVEGTGGRPLAGGAEIATRLDHRIAMSFAVLGLACAAPTRIDDARPIDTSFPGFLGLMNRLGAGLAIN
jgi:3-phosphoshikimate 1-carboxyvinyltransferase